MNYNQSLRFSLQVVFKLKKTLKNSIVAFISTIAATLGAALGSDNLLIPPIAAFLGVGLFEMFLLLFENESNDGKSRQTQWPFHKRMIYWIPAIIPIAFCSPIFLPFAWHDWNYVILIFVLAIFFVPAFYFYYHWLSFLTFSILLDIRTIVACVLFMILLPYTPLRPFGVYSIVLFFYFFGIFSLLLPGEKRDRRTKKFLRWLFPKEWFID